MLSFSSTLSLASSTSSNGTNSFGTDSSPRPSGVLFASTHKRDPNLPSLSQLSPSQKKGLGYFAFPPNSTPLRLVPSPEETARKAKEAAEILVNQQHEEQLRKEEEARKTRLAAEADEARRGEEAWIRVGGTLLDANGRRDVARTKAMREELRVRDIEEALTMHWGAYESAWQAMSSQLARQRHLRFSDIPWPVHPPATQLSDVTMKKVEAFLMDPLTVRGTTVTRKDRIRSSLLRWHPDKMTKILASVKEEDERDVEEAIGIVVRRLHEMNARDRSGGPP